MKHSKSHLNWRKNLRRECSNPGTGCPQRNCGVTTLGELRTWLDMDFGGVCSAGFMAGLDDLKGLSQPKWSCGPQQLVLLEPALGGSIPTGIFCPAAVCCTLFYSRDTEAALQDGHPGTGNLPGKAGLMPWRNQPEPQVKSGLLCLTVRRWPIRN